MGNTSTAEILRILMAHTTAIEAFPGISNANAFYSAHYLESILEWQAKTPCI